MFRDANGGRNELTISIDVWIISHINQQKYNKIVDARVESDTSSSYDAPAIMVTFFAFFLILNCQNTVPSTKIKRRYKQTVI